MNPDLQAALDSYVVVLQEMRSLDPYRQGAEIHATYLKGQKAWQRCVVLGATRAHQHAAHERERAGQ